MKIKSPFNTITFLERVTFTKHLAVLIRSGITIDEALAIIRDETASSVLRQILDSVTSEVKNGKSLSAALGKHRQAFNQFYLSLIKIGESTGKLDETLTYLADYLSQSFQLRRKIQTALLYPAVILIATFIVGGFIAFYILPQLIGFFESFEAKLPLSTRVLLSVAHLLQDYGVFIVIGLIALIAGFISLLRVPYFRLRWQFFLLYLPLVGRLINQSQLAQFNRNLSTLLSSGTPIDEALTTTNETLDSLVHQRYLLKAIKQVKNGKPLSKALEEVAPERVFPPLVTRMIAVGEKSGQLDQNLAYLATFYEDEIDNTSKNLTTILEPVLLVIIGLGITFVALAIITPIYELTSTVGEV